MEEVVLSFVMVSVIVLYSDSRFQGVFEAICKFLLITLWPLARGKHKGNSVEKHHQFLNKTQAITGKYCGSHGVFMKNAKTS